MPETASAIAADLIDEVGASGAIAFMVDRLTRCSSVSEVARGLALLVAIAWRILSK